MAALRPGWRALRSAIVDCERCPRLRDHCREVAGKRRRAYADQEYWGRPVPGFGDTSARLLLVGLAPGAHGANRTGRMFTGDRSGEWLYGALHRAGFANRPESVTVDDGLRLDGAFVSGVCRCAPPANRPTREEMDRCEEYLATELVLLGQLRVVVALGQIAWDALWRRAGRLAPEERPSPRPRFGHGARTELPLAPGRRLTVLGSYHPSQQNTQTGRLTRPMFDAVLRQARRLSGTRGAYATDMTTKNPGPEGRTEESG